MNEIPELSDHLDDPILCVEGLSTFEFSPRFIADLDDVLADKDDSICDDNTINISNVLQSESRVPEVIINGYRDVVAEVDTGAEVTVTNLLWVLHNIIWYKESNKKCPVAMYGATSATLI